MPTLFDVPEVVFRLIHEFFFYPFFSSQRIYTDKEWRDFLNTTKLLCNVKKETIYLYLNQKASLRYLYEDHFRSQILSHMKEPCRQLGINLTNFNHFLPQISSSSSSFSSTSSSSSYNVLYYLNNIHFLNLSCVKFSGPELSNSGCQEIHEIFSAPYIIFTGFQRIHKLSFQTNFLIPPLDSSYLSLLQVQIHDIKSDHCGLTPIILKTISQIPSLQKLSLKEGNFNDVSMFSHIKDLDLDISKNRFIEEISCLPNCKRLILQKCSNLQRVSHLNNCQELDLSDTSISDVNGLGHVKILRLHRCSKVMNVSSLVGLDLLDLSWCDNVKDISMLGKVKKLILYGWYREKIPNAFTNVIPNEKPNYFLGLDGFEASFLKERNSYQFDPTKSLDLTSISED